MFLGVQTSFVFAIFKPNHKKHCFHPKNHEATADLVASSVDISERKYITVGLLKNIPLPASRGPWLDLEGRAVRREKNVCPGDHFKPRDYISSLSGGPSAGSFLPRDSRAGRLSCRVARDSVWWKETEEWCLSTGLQFIVCLAIATLFYLRNNTSLVFLYSFNIPIKT